MLNLTNILDIPCDVHFTLTASADKVNDAAAYGAFHACAISASLFGLTVSVDDFLPDGSARMVATGPAMTLDAGTLSALTLTTATEFGLSFSPLIVANI